MEMVDISFSMPRGLLLALGRSEENQQVFHRFLDSVLMRISSIYHSRNLKKKVYHSPRMIVNTECPICLDPIRLYSSINILPCRHGFHVGCAKELTNSHHYQCPLCRALM